MYSHNGEGTLALLALVVAGALCARWLWTALFGSSTPPAVDESEEFRQALAIVTAPRQMPDGSWQQLELTWKPCPIGQSGQPLPVRAGAAKVRA